MFTRIKKNMCLDILKAKVFIISELNCSDYFAGIHQSHMTDALSID